MAEAFFQKYAPEEFEVYSAGLEPRPIHPLSIQAMREVGIDISGKQSKSVREYLGKKVFAHVIFVCEETEQKCPNLFPMSSRQSLSWPFTDPAAVAGSEREQVEAFQDVRDRIERKVKSWLIEYRNKTPR